MAEKKKSGGDGDAITGLLIVLAFLVLLVPVLLAALLSFIIRRTVRPARSGWVAVFIFAVVVLFVTKGAPFVDWILWLVNMTNGQKRSFVPPVGVVPLAMLLASGFNMVSPALFKEAMQGNKLFGWLRLRQAKKDIDDQSFSRAEKDLISVGVARPGGIAAPGSSASYNNDVVKMPDAVSAKGIPLGLGKGRRPIILAEQELEIHGICLGSTGSGKTVALKNIIGGAVDLGWTIIVIDLKQDLAPNGLREYCRDTAKIRQMSYQEMILSEPQDVPGRSGQDPWFWFNALQGLNESEAVDAVLGLVEFDDAHWQALSRRVLLQTCNLFYQAHALNPDKWPEPNLFEIGAALTEGSGSGAGMLIKERLVEVKKLLGADVSQHFRALEKPTPDEAKQMSSMGTKLTNLFETSVGKYALRPSAGSQSIDLTATGGVTYMGLDSNALPDLAKMVSTAALIRLNVMASQVIRQMRPKTKTLIIVDEANELSMPQVKNFLSRARSAGLSMWLATQGAKDWIRNGEDWWSPLLQNVSCGIIMQQKELQSAELAAAFLGTTEKMQISESIRDNTLGTAGMLRGSVDFVIPPHQLQPVADDKGNHINELEAYIKSNWRPPTFVRLGIRTSDGDWIWPQRAQIPQ